MLIRRKVQKVADVQNPDKIGAGRKCILCIIFKAMYMLSQLYFLNIVQVLTIIHFVCKADWYAVYKINIYLVTCRHESGFVILFYQIISFPVRYISSKVILLRKTNGQLDCLSNCCFYFRLKANILLFFFLWFRYFVTRNVIQVKIFFIYKKLFSHLPKRVADTSISISDHWSCLRLNIVLSHSNLSQMNQLVYVRII